MNEKRLELLRALETRLNYRFNRIEWLDQALTHKSFTHQSGAPPIQHSQRTANEILEFIGDAVLNLAVSHLLTQIVPEACEGSLSQMRSHLVKRTTLAAISRSLHLEEYLLLGKGELLNGGKKKTSILANAYEALIGAVYRDSGFEQALELVKRHMKSYLDVVRPDLCRDSCFSDYKSLLQQQVQRRFKTPPSYRVVCESGPDHDKRYLASVTIAGEAKGTGWGRSKKEAEQQAAKQALSAFGMEIERAPVFFDLTLHRDH